MCMQRERPIRLGVFEVVLTDVAEWVPETPHNDLQPQLPAAQPRIARGVDEVIVGCLRDLVDKRGGDPALLADDLSAGALRVALVCRG